MSTSERRCGLAGSSGPWDACTAHTESSTVIRWVRPPVRSFSVRPSVGRISASLPCTTCERLSLVETCTVRSARRIAFSVTCGVRARRRRSCRRGRRTPARRRRGAADRLDGVEAVLPRRVEAELLLEGVQEVCRRPLPDAHRAVALDVGVAADREQSGAGLADVALQEGDVADLLDGRDRVAVLGDPHRPADDGRVGVAEHLRRLLDLCAGQPGGLLDGHPVELADVLGPLLEARRVPLDEVVVDAVPLEQQRPDRLQQGQVAVDPDRQVQVLEVGAEPLTPPGSAGS